MQLPFTHDQFLDVFASYNRALWPVAFALSIRADLWLVAAGLLLLVYVARTTENVRANTG